MLMPLYCILSLVLLTLESFDIINMLLGNHQTACIFVANYWTTAVLGEHTR